MSYNGSGTFVINSTGQPVVTGTVISSSTFNSLTADLGTGLTTAITKDGQTTTTAKIPFAQGLSAAVASNFAAGTVGAPSIYLSTDTTTGLYRIGANNDGFAISGVKLLDIGSALLGITGALTVSTTLGVTGATTLSSTLAAGNTTITGTLASGALTVTGTGKVSTGFAVGNATPGAGGIAFPATAVAVADANTLDDYEEGTFTATLKGSTADPLIAVTTTGYYTKVGNLVSVNIVFSNVTTTGATGGVIVTGLPFTAASTSTDIGSVMSYQFAFNGLTSVCSYVGGSTTQMDFQTSGNNANWQTLSHNAGVGRYLWTSSTYRV